MKKEVKLLKKVKRLIRRIGCGRWLHHFGPKTYEFYQHLMALLVRHYCQLSYRRVNKLLDLLGFICPSKSALQYTAKKISSIFWDRILALTSGDTYIVAIDSTGFSRSNPSYHYIKRIDGKTPKIPIKLSAGFDTRKKKFTAAKIRVLPAHDVRDAPKIIKESEPKIIVADKGYDSEKLYHFSYENGALFMAPIRKNVKRGRYRKKMHQEFRKRTYNRRQLVEAGFGSIKRKMGSSVSSKTVRTIRSEIYGRLVCHNVLGILIRDF